MKPYLIFLLVWSFFAEPASAAGRPTVANEDFSLTLEQQASLAEIAYGGDEQAAMRLSNCFFFAYDPDRQQQLNENALKWALIGAENGSVDAQFRVFSLLSESEDRLQQIRALYWLKRAAERGSASAKATLNSCPSITSKRRSGRPCFGPEQD